MKYGISYIKIKRKACGIRITNWKDVKVKNKRENNKRKTWGGKAIEGGKTS